jgi:hypothetical protein
VHARTAPCSCRSVKALETAEQAVFLVEIIELLRCRRRARSARRLRASCERAGGRIGTCMGVESIGHKAYNSSWGSFGAGESDAYSLKHILHVCVLFFGT